MSKPNIYYLSTKPRIVLSTTDVDGNPIVPTEARLSIEAPDLTVFTVSGTAMTQSGNDLVYQCDPDQVGWWVYEAWVKDNVGRESAQSRGFYVTDKIPN